MTNKRDKASPLINLREKKTSELKSKTIKN